MAKSDDWTTHLNSMESSPHIDLSRFRARMGTSKIWPFLNLQRSKMSPPNLNITHGISSITLPYLSLIGSLRGKISSWVATRIVDATGGCTRRVSRTTASRYGRALSSSIVGLSVPTERSSFRSLSCASRFWVNAKSAQVVAVLFRHNQKHWLLKLCLVRPSGFMSSN